MHACMLACMNRKDVCPNRIGCRYGAKTLGGKAGMVSCRRVSLESWETSIVVVDCCISHNIAQSFSKMASASFNPLNDHGREDRFPTPVVPPGERYVFETPSIILLKDKAQAANNAIKEVFPDSEIHESMCMTHASIIWMSKNTQKFWRADVH